ncbi:hypothetical protein DL96DRAFT_1706506 [Flagelloscypha sp. PMI_526]|nr:hypothetical protein DL96DRAFT_1706506 [Flagelloscypha sp. PMI_526]
MSMVRTLIFDFVGELPPNDPEFIRLLSCWVESPTPKKICLLQDGLYLGVSNSYLSGNLLDAVLKLVHGRILELEWEEEGGPPEQTTLGILVSEAAAVSALRLYECSLLSLLPPLSTSGPKILHPETFLLHYPPSLKVDFSSQNLAQIISWQNCRKLTIDCQLSNVCAQAVSTMLAQCSDCLEDFRWAPHWAEFSASAQMCLATLRNLTSLTVMFWEHDSDIDDINDCLSFISNTVIAESCALSLLRLILKITIPVWVLAPLNDAYSPLRQIQAHVYWEMPHLGQNTSPFANSIKRALKKWRDGNAVQVFFVDIDGHRAFHDDEYETLPY